MGLLDELVRIWSTDPAIEGARQRISAATSGREIITITGDASRAHRERFGDLMRILLDTAPHDAAVAAQLDSATKQFRAELAEYAERLAQLGPLRDGIDETHAVDILWFYFGYSSYFTLTDENGWPLAEAEKWLLAQASATLLR